MYIIVLNQTNVIQDGYNNKLVYKFPNSVPLFDKYIALSSITMYNSWFNIMTQYNNNTFTYTWTNNLGVTTVYNVTMPNGIYDIPDINKFIQFTCIQNGTYWSDAGLNYYPFELQVNTVRYSIQLNTYLIPTSSPTLSTIPPPAGWPNVTQNSVVSFPALFYNVVGYQPINNVIFSSAANVANAYVPPGSSQYTYYATKDANGTLSYLSINPPNVHPNDTIYLTASNINNPYCLPSSIIYSLTSDAITGDLINEKPPNYAWTKMINGTYNELRFSLIGSDLQPLYIADPLMNITLVIRDKDESYLGAK